MLIRSGNATTVPGPDARLSGALPILCKLPGIDAHHEPGVVSSLLIGPPFLADFSLNEEFLPFLAMLGEGFCRFTPELEVDKVGDGFTVARLGQIRVVIGERDFYEAFAILRVGEFRDRRPNCRSTGVC